MSENTVMKRVPMDVPFAAEDTAPYIFISYAHDDSERVFPIIKVIHEMGWHVWYDQGIEINTNYHNVIADHVLGCEVVLLFVSKVSVTRDYVTDTEVGFALDNKKRVVFCFLDESELPSGIRSRSRDTERHPRTTPEGLCEVLESIKELTRVPEREAKGIRINAQVKGELAISNESDEYESVAMDNGGVRLTEYKGNAENVVVPARWKGRPVVELRETFRSNKRVKSVTIPDSVTSIGEWAFGDCSSLTAITIPDSVTSIGNLSFNGCSSLTAITIPDSVTSIGDLAFYGCSSLTVECEENSCAHQYAKKEKIPVRIVKLKKKEKTAKRTASDKIPFISDKEVPFVYCSYAHENADIVFPIMKRLHDDGFNIRYDELNRNPYECAGEIRDCAYFLAFLTPAYIDSAISELRLSWPQGRILYWLEACKLPNDLEMNQGCIQGLCVWERTYEDIVTTIEATLDKGGCRGRRTAVIPDFEYRADDTGITLLKYTGKSENVVIKSEYSGLPVTSIGDCAFYGCSSLIAITIPDSVTSIGNTAFSGCSSLTAITIPDSVTSIGDYAFGGCSSLTAITIPDSVTSIGNYAFDGCSSLTAITIPDSVTSIGERTFYGCRSLTAITIPDSVTRIGWGAFDGCSSLTAITIPDSVTSIGDLAFYGCSSLTAITIPDSVTSIGVKAFDGCSSLTAVTIPDSVTSIGDWAFDGCDDLTAYCSENSHAWQYCEENKIKHEPLTAAPTEGVPNKKSPARWLVPLLILLALAAAAGLQLSGLVDILSLLGL